MNSQERHELRYQRRKQKRLEKKLTVNNIYDNFDIVFSYQNLYSSYKSCCLGVGWKSSIQRYISNGFYNVNMLYKSLLQNKYRHKKYNVFDVIDRGKARRIQSVQIQDRVVQKCLCNNTLEPLLKKTFIYDNCACIKNKGVHFAMDRMNRHIEKYYRACGNTGYALVFDFSSYFKNIDHDILLKVLHREIRDKRITDILIDAIKGYGERGLGLGSQVSQYCALALPNKLDHFIKEKLHIGYYCRYMDDGCLIHHDKTYLHHCLKEISKICDELGIILNKKKTQIIALSRGIPFLKTRFILTSTGKILRIPNKKNITKMRHKLKTFKRWFDNGVMGLDEIRTSYLSWRSHQKNMNSYWSVKRMDDFYNSMFMHCNTD